MQNTIIQRNRGFLYGDALFETIKVLDRKVLYLEDHYFRLMASMRILRMEIPMDFTLEFFESQILEAVEKQGLEKSARVRFNVFRDSDGFYLPSTNEVSFFATVAPLEKQVYEVADLPYEVDIYKDYIVPSHLLSTIKSTNRVLNVIGSIYAKENVLDNCLLLNQDKNVVEALNGNLFMVKDHVIVTPPLTDGCINGVMRKQVIEAVRQGQKDYVLEERSISVFELQKADELFITNVIKGVQPITLYRKKKYEIAVAKMLVNKLNITLRLL